MCTHAIKYALRGTVANGALHTHTHTQAEKVNICHFIPGAMRLYKPLLY